MKPLALLLVVAIVVVPGAPVFAKEQHSATKSKSLASTPMEKSKSLGYASEPMDRSEALQKCNAEAAKWSNRDWQTTQATVYGDCMRKYGQPQ
jgi:hypothetical protein